MYPTVLTRRIDRATFEQGYDMMCSPLFRPMSFSEDPSTDNGNRNVDRSGNMTQELGTEAIWPCRLVNPEFAQKGAHITTSDRKPIRYGLRSWRERTPNNFRRQSEFSCQVSANALALSSGFRSHSPEAALNAGNKAGADCLFKSCLFKAHHFLEPL